MNSARPLLFLLAGVLLCGVLLRAEGDAPQTTAFAPLDYFNDKCARCHGAYGAFYGPDFGKGKTDAQLGQAVKEMCEGPAEAPLSPHDLDVLVAWHRALRDGQPFVAAVTLDKGVLGGEASPNAAVSLETTAGETVTLPLQGHKWRVGLPEGVQLARIHAELNGKSAEFDPRKEAFAPQ